MEKIIDRLSVLYKRRKEDEHIFVHQTIRWSKRQIIDEAITDLKELNIRIFELERFLSHNIITKTKEKCGVV